MIAIEGHDGSGKTTVAKKIADVLGRPIITFPDRSTPVGQRIDAMLRGAVPGDPVVLQALMTVNKYETSIPWNAIVVRYWQSAVVYGQLDGLDRDWLYEIHGALPSCALNVLLDVSPATLQARRAGRGGQVEMYETVDKDERIVSLYREEWARHEGDPEWLVVPEGEDAVRAILKAVPR